MFTVITILLSFLIRNTEFLGERGYILLNFEFLAPVLWSKINSLIICEMIVLMVCPK